MEAYIELIGTLQNSGFWLVQVVIGELLSKDEICLAGPKRSLRRNHQKKPEPSEYWPGEVNDK